MSDARVNLNFDDMGNHSSHSFMISAATTSESTKNQIAIWYIMAYASPICGRVYITPKLHAAVPGIPQTQTRRIVYYLFPFRQFMDCNIHRVNETHCTTFTYNISTKSMNMHTSFPYH